MRIRHVALLGALAVAGLAPQVTAACEVEGTIVGVGQKPPSMSIHEDATDGETRYFEIEVRSVPGWQKFEVGQKVEGTCEDNGESPPRITSLRRKRDRR